MKEAVVRVPSTACQVSCTSFPPRILPASAPLTGANLTLVVWRLRPACWERV